jgi:hypothetical protein
MELRRCGLRRYTLTDEDGATATIVHRPLTVAWRLRLGEGHRPFDEADPLGWLRERYETSAALYRDLLEDVVERVEGLTLGGVPLDREAAIDALIEAEAPAEAFVLALLRASTVEPEQGKR